METRQLLQLVKEGKMSIHEAEKLLKKLPYEDLDFAKLDHHRALRTGFGEVVFCQSKTPEQNAEIFAHFYAAGKNVLGTRADQTQYEAVKQSVPGAQFDPISRCIIATEQHLTPKGSVAVCTGGTSDMPVAEEAAKTAEFFGARVSRFYDVGVAGIHRLFANMEQINQANCIIAVAGMEGALPGVIAGLTDRPVIAVPTSVGYGANFEGLSALLTMLNSCAEGIGVVNIDNGFGAGYLAAQINRLVCDGKSKEER